jgi:hypothetical protein
MITLYFRSSGDGNVSKLSTIGFDKSRSITNDQDRYRRKIHITLESFF